MSVLDVSTRTYPNGRHRRQPGAGLRRADHRVRDHGEPQPGLPDRLAVSARPGIEYYYEQYLRGHDGTRTFKVDAYGDILGAVKSTAPTAGDTVELNIDLGLQKALDGILANGILSNRSSIDPRSGKHPPSINGAAVVLDPNTGAVLAMSSYPSYDLKSFVNGLSESTFKHLLAVGAFNNYAIQGLYTPGSTFKLVTATAQLQTGILSPNAIVDDTGTFKVPGLPAVGQPRLRLPRRRDRRRRA